MGVDSDSPASSTRPPHSGSGRKGSKKVRTGCITCKIRKVKCDEAKPYCMRCTKTGRRCDGYLDAKTMAQRRRRPAGPVAGGGTGEPRASMPHFYGWASSDERRAFHFFQHVTAPSLSGGLDGAFWRVLVLQICQTEPAVKHAVLAVSSFHEGMVQAAALSAQGAGIEDRSSFALYQYNRAIACLLDQMRTVDARPLVPLLTCVLFVCIELMQNKDKESLLHLEQGRQILSQLGRKEPAHSAEIDLIKQHLVPMYTRLSLTSLMFGGEPLQIPTPLKTLTELPMVFESIHEVRYALYDFMDECLRFAKKTHVAKIGGISPEEMRVFEGEQDYLLRKLAKFNVAFSLYRSTRSRDAPAGFIALLQIHAHTTYIWVSTALNQHETVFDDYVDTFSAIIPLATEFILSLSAPQPATEQERLHVDTRRFTSSFTFEIHIIAPLYFVVAKCRHPIIRRAALELLRRNPSRRENLWRANVMATIAERTMHLEEKHLRDANSQPQSRHPSPPEIPMLFASSFAHEADPWLVGLPDASYPDTFDADNLDLLGAATGNKPSHGSLDASHVPVTSSGSTASTTGSVDIASLGDLAGHLPIDPTLFFDPAEGSTAHSFSAAPSIASSLDDHGAPAAVSTPYLGASMDAPSTELWSGSTSSHPPPGIALEPPTPMDDNPFSMSLPPHHPQPHSQPQSRAHSRQPSGSGGSPSLASDGSPPLYPMEGSPMLGSAAMPGFQQQRYPGFGVGHLSPATGKRSADAPFDVPERFRVHESIIGPDREDGTSWVMMFRKLGGLDAEWDVLTEYVAVA